jgi:hypothetical protein
LRRELEAGKRVDGDGIGADERAELEDDKLDVARLEQPAKRLAEVRDVGTRDRAADGEGDRSLPGGGQRRAPFVLTRNGPLSRAILIAA